MFLLTEGTPNNRHDVVVHVVFFYAIHAVH
jgi:hypothetical protein